mgnify:FL=1
MDRFYSRVTLAALMVLSAPAAYAATTGNITGRVTDESNGKPLAGVTVVVSGPQGEQTEFTDSNGSYTITDLPPGEYVVRFFYANVKIERPGVIVSADKTLSVGAGIPTGKAQVQEIRVTERAPTVDVATTQVQTQVSDELVRNTPVGRSYTSVLTLAPGSSTDATGASFNGATGPENQYLIDGLNTTNPSFGLVGTPLTVEFIKETEIITGGYNAEFGRATGGVVNVVTKSGTNEFHGGAWFFYTPFQLTPLRIARPGEAIAFTAKTKNAFDFGFDIGGPIVKDRLWFYAGFAPQFNTREYDRILRTRTSDQAMGMNVAGAYAGDPDTTIACPSYLSSTNAALCEAAKAGSVITKDLEQKYWRHIESDTRIFALIGKLNLRINDNNNLSVTYIGNPSTFEGVSTTLRFNANPDALRYSEPGQTHDVVARFTSKLLDRRLQIDILAGFHFETDEIKPIGADGDKYGQNTDTRTVSLANFENAPDGSALDVCKPQKLANGQTFNPCPVSNYRDRGFGFVSRTSDMRITAAASATYFLKLLGTHALKLGGDFEYNAYTDFRRYSGGDNGGRFTTFADGSVERDQFGTVDSSDPTGMKVKLLPNGFEATTTTLNESVYLRDSWNFSFLPGFTLNLGVRWEGQQVRDINGKTQIGIYDNWAPRLGFVYDFTGKGRSKLYASYGQFYESVPLDMNDRQFSGEGIAIQYPADSCMADMNGRVDPSTCKFPAAARGDINGGTFGLVSPVLKGQYSNEVVAGLQYDVGLDLVLGAAYIHRDLGRIIEDVSPDGGRTYVIANPGESPDAGTVKGLQGQIDDLNKQIAASGDMARQTELTKLRDDRTQQLALYKAGSTFEKPKRDYNALVLTVSKRLSYNFIVLASYTYSRTIGNYPGLFQASNGQLDPNISSQYDLPELLVNRNGPLPSDKPHNFKVTGAYNLPLGEAGTLNFGLNFFLQSGSPIEVLGRHPTYGSGESFILPRGSGGRLPMLTQLDLRVAYSKQFAKRYRVELSLDVFNVLNLQQVTSIDQNYTVDRVLPMVGGTYESLKNLTTTSGTVPRLNPNYGQPTGYQAPLSMRIGARFAF